jgi:gas vesicle protein GvpL/GvpF
MSAERTTGTYVYCVVASERKPNLRGVPRGLSGAGPVRLLDLPAARRQSSGRWLVVADVPLERYGEKPINAGLSNLNWVSRAAISHEGVVEGFTGATGLLPMKLFTIFASDERALEYIHAERRRIDSALARVLHHEEWGVRVALTGRRMSAGSGDKGRSRTPLSGSGYLEHKKLQRDVAVELAQHAKEIAADLYDLLAKHSTIARRRSVTELPSSGGALLLDAVFLVKRARAAIFRKAVERQARGLKSDGYAVSLSGPWPPYSFMQD